MSKYPAPQTDGHICMDMGKETQEQEQEQGHEHGHGHGHTSMDTYANMDKGIWTHELCTWIN